MKSKRVVILTKVSKMLRKSNSAVVLTKVRTTMCLLTLIALQLSSCKNNQQFNNSAELEQIFKNPSEESRPWVYWYWMIANATSDGITRDLEAMAETGIGGAYLMPIGNSAALATEENLSLADPPADPLSDHWWDLVVHATKEADRLGLKLAMNACDGWALAGGPWITPELSMQEVVISRTEITGGNPFHGKLEQPETRYNYYRDIAVLAFPDDEKFAATSTSLQPKATTNIPGLDAQELITGAEKPIYFSSQGWIQFEFDKPFTCRSIKLSPAQNFYQLHRAKLSVSDDGISFRSLGRLRPTDFHGWQDREMDCTQSIEEVTARFFRFEIDTSGTPEMTENAEGTKLRSRNRLGAQHIELRSRPAIHQWEGKAGYRWRRSVWTTENECPADLCVPLEDILNITDKLNGEGVLTWTPPPGKWIVQRIGYTTTGETNNPAGAGSGLESDKFSKEATKIQFEGWFGGALEKVGEELAGKTMHRNHTDSWEAFSQNWSPVFREEFVKRRGYDPVPWLPAMAGVPLESAALSERFLYDVRRTIADLVCDNFYDPFVKEGDHYGATFSAECIAPTMMSDGLQHYKYVDLPMGEFWLNSVNQDKPNDIQDAISGAHIYGKKTIGAEAFTQNPITWTVDPYYLKPMADYNFTRGINQFVLHVWAHQAFDKSPGITLRRVGTFFSGTQTWHKPGKAFITYLHRCSEMLQQGLPVADACYFIGEEQPARSFLRHELPLPLPEGYTYDCINRDALLTRAKAENNRLVLPDGMSYRLLVIPPSLRMTPEIAAKIGELAEAGVPVIATLPEQSISLTNYPDCDTELKAIVSNLWNRVKKNAEISITLEEAGIMPDITFLNEDQTRKYRQKMEYHSPSLSWTHRKTNNADIYFISNQERTMKNVDVSFRITGMIPELWDASTGHISDAGIWKEENNRTIVNLQLDPAGSVFVVFRKKTKRADVDVITNIAAKNEKVQGNDQRTIWVEDDTVWSKTEDEWEVSFQSGKKRTGLLDNLSSPIEVSGPWKISFELNNSTIPDIKLTSLISLSEHSKEEVKYFSGTATYKTNFGIEELKPDERLFLELGKVMNLAKVTLNGSDLGVLWKPPFNVEISSCVKKGSNELMIEVTNTWHNRLVGDAELSKDERSTWLLYEDARPGKDEPLEPSGLIGPVVIRSAGKVVLK